MGRLKIFAMTAIAAATIGVGGLMAAPSASAMPDCQALADKGQAYYDTANALYWNGNYSLAMFYWGKSEAYFEMATACYRS
jgi:hypothetical protein